MESHATEAFDVKSRFFYGQAAHLLLLIGLVVAALLLVDFDQLRDRQLTGIDASVWFVVALAVPVLHQVYVWLAWRSELCFGTVTKRFGTRAFVVYEVAFMVLLAARPVSLILLALADLDSLTLPVFARVLICTVLVIPAAYTLYSVARYFGFSRAAGADHFDEGYRNKPLVKKGIFRYSNNSMYSFGFLVLWAIAVAGASRAALVVALFSHLYIWVHYFCTERPDMNVIYGKSVK